MPNKSPGPNSSDFSQDRFSGTSDSAESMSRDEMDVAGFSRKMLIKLGRTIEYDVIPRLMLALGPQSIEDDLTDRRGAAEAADRVEEFVDLVLAHDTPVAIKYVTTLRSEGMPLATVYLDLLSPAARRLGEMWENDECSFTDVTIGVCRMHQVLLEFSRCFDATSDSTHQEREALIVPAPGEQHTFGIFMIMEFLRRRGWDCFSGAPATSKAFQTLVNAHAFGVIGISISADKHIDATAGEIDWIRSRSRNRDAVILVGGSAIQKDPGLVHKMGADGTASDGEEAVRTIARLTRKKSENPAN
jgi:methanogenic corrinoid protein MtbC1